MKTKFKALLRALPVLLLATLAFTATVMPVSAAVAPTSGYYGSSVTVTATVANADQVYSVYFSQSGTERFAGSILATGTTLNGNVSVPPLPRGVNEVIVRNAADTVSAGTFTMGQTLFFSPSSQSVGSPVTVTGYGFTANTSVSIYFGSITTPAATVTSNSSGQIAASFNAPSVARDSYLIYAREGSFTPVYATGFLTINPGIASLSATSGKVGDTITVTGGGFTAGGTVQLYFDTVDDANLLKTITANSSTSTTPGAISTTIVIPAGVRGNHNIIARDVASTTNTPAKVFTVTPAITIVSPSGASPSGPVNSQIELKGSGFNANSTITFKFDGATLTTTKQTDDKGSFANATITVPTNKTSGTYVITASDSTGAAPGVEFTVAASITLNPTSGTAGSTVSVQGNGFQTTGTVSITYDNAVMTTATLTNGTFTATFTIPGGVAGAHTVRATDGLSNTAVATFTSTLSATLSPITSTAAPGHVGQDLTLTGTGFLPTSAITASFGTTAIGSATSDATGAFTITFKAPAVGAGSHTVTVTDGTNTRTFTFVMEGNAPAAPELVTPDGVNKPKQPIVYEWSDVTDDSGVTYTLEVFTTAELNVLILKKEGLTTSSYTAAETEKLPSVSKDAPYYWRVTAIDGAGNVGTPAQAIAFTVGFSISDLIPDNVPTWAWITIGVFVVLIAGGLIYYFWRRSYSY